MVLIILLGFSTIAIPASLCQASSVGLVRYPATLAAASGPVTVNARCADNAHAITGLSVTCTSDGGWSGATPHCVCDEGYYLNTDGDMYTCQGKF